MVSPLKYDFSLNGAVLSSKTRNTDGFSQSVGMEYEYKSNILGKPLILSDQDDFHDWRRRIKSPRNSSVRAQASICVSRSMRWWEKTLKPNMIEIHSAQQLVDSLRNAGDQLVILDFYSPGCGGCRALHPKICKVAESYPDAIFLKVNYEELKTMCHSLHIHVLPFFRFYRGSEGRLCSFSCTNATIKKLNDAMVKHGADRCGLGPAKGLNESEILALSSVGLLPNYLPFRSDYREPKMEELIMKNIDLGGLWTNKEHQNNVKQVIGV
ncbi:thioredoxin-like 1-2, chloroplastic [Euphorbia lathyris]|uniref:thioredoxin-like 1-2, chloroplastic n=1 Tax=Euphorbia lathyris TaxID=212925 RepID=UPI0033136DD5